MKYSISYQIEPIDNEQLMKYFKPEEVFSYCSACPNHARIWSCPPHDISINDYLSAYNQIWIIGAKLHIKPEWIDEKNKEQSVMNVFLEARKQFGDKLFELEKRYKNSNILLAGTCYQCKECTRDEGKECRFKDKLRYSLESIGFLVSDIVSDVLKDEIRWVKDGELPEYILSVGALMLEEAVDELLPLLD